MAEENQDKVHEEEVPKDTKPSAPEKDTKWYVLRVVSGKERKVKEYLDKDIVRGRDGIRIFSRFFCRLKKFTKW